MTDIHGMAVHGYLREVVEMARLQELADKFAKATGVAVLVVDVDGTPITRPSNFTSFCRLMRSSLEGEEECRKSDRLVEIEAAEWRTLRLIKCHCGLILMAAPLILDGVYWGAVLCGQVLLEPPDEELLNRTREAARRFGIVEEELLQAWGRINVVSETSVRAAGELLQIVASYIVEMSISHLAHQRLTRQLKEKARMERVMQQLELRALQSQVNPHFLFNTLNTASRLALIEGAGQTEELIHALARLLRYTLRNIDQLVPLREELGYIQNYLFIQKTRYADHIEIRIDVRPEVLEARIPVMTLQPVVENAIVHGLEPKEDGGMITISARVVECKICIEIRDTGPGMDITNIDCLLEGVRSGRGHTTGLGLSNVHRRLQHCFGSEYGLKISSLPGNGTTVAVWIPYQG